MVKKCDHKWIYDGIVKVRVKKPEQQYTEVYRLANTDPLLISKGKTYFPDRHQFHCERCCEIKRLI